jgi:hypothetical protein
LKVQLGKIKEKMATKEDLTRFATKEDLTRFKTDVLTIFEDYKKDTDDKFKIIDEKIDGFDERIIEALRATNNKNKKI